MRLQLPWANARCHRCESVIGSSMHACASNGPDIAVRYLVLVTMVFNALAAVGSAPRCVVVQAVMVPVAPTRVPVMVCDLVGTGPPL